jgi:alanyl-tRNA synthetase
LEKEEHRFLETLENGMKVFEKIIKNNSKIISGKDAFLMYQSYGFPFEITKELAQEKGIKVNEKEFNKELKNHQELSRTATQGKFKSGLQDNSEQITKLHTATHLLHAALRKVLGNVVQQKGSNITAKRLRFDFSFNRKLTNEEIKKVEDIVNETIKQKLKVLREEMPQETAKHSGALGFFEHKYRDIVSVYTIGDKTPFSKEICTGPHAENTSELGKFKILKEEASAAGIRRIKAILK